jgi:hypothetical protein
MHETKIQQLQKKKKKNKQTRLCQGNISKINVEQTKGDGEFYLYLLGI